MRSGESMLNDLMVLARKLLRSKLEGELVELAGEAERHLIVLVVYGRAGIDTHVEGLIDTHEEWNGVGYFPSLNFLIIYLQNACSTFAKARTVIGEVEHHSMFPRWQRLLTFPTV